MQCDTVNMIKIHDRFVAAVIKVSVVCSSHILKILYPYIFRNKEC